MVVIDEATQATEPATLVPLTQVRGLGVNDNVTCLACCSQDMTCVQAIAM
jgi:hypothetical protein